MDFLICNFSITSDMLIENHLDLAVFKELAYNSKIARKLPNSKKALQYNYILIPLVHRTEQNVILEANLVSKMSSSIEIEDDYIFSIAEIFKTNFEKIENIGFSLDLIGLVDDSRFDIFYSDGSFKRDTAEASYGMCKLLGEDAKGLKDDLTGKTFLHEEFSGKILKGTNNIGELSGLQKAIEVFGKKDYQIIISDSEYSIKIFREWYYTWKDNGFRTYAKKPIMNRTLIESIYKSLIDSKKVVLFKWVRGHNDSFFNEQCDEIAKNALQIKK